MDAYFFVYIFVAILCLVFSFIKIDALLRKFWIYFTAVIMVDLYMYFGFPYTEINMHPFAIIFYNLFFIWYFRELYDKSYKIILVVAIFVFIFILVFKENPYDIKIILSMLMVFFSLPLLWLTKQLHQTDGVNILEKHLFWVSIGMLFWIIVFSFKLAPLYFLYLNDKDFLLQIDTIFQYVNILFYVIVLKSIFCKY